jgi:hypothetical protein
MSKLLTGSIELTKIDKTKIVEKDGRKWLNITVWLNDEKDKYGNCASIQISAKKEEPKIYIGNLKEYEAKPTPDATPQPASEVQQDDDNLPF